METHGADKLDHEELEICEDQRSRAEEHLKEYDESREYIEHVAKFRDQRVPLKDFPRELGALGVHSVPSPSIANFRTKSNSPVRIVSDCPEEDHEVNDLSVKQPVIADLE